MATTEDWAATEDFANDPIATGTRCILDLRRRVEALEALEQQRAATEESSATEPAPAPAADRPLWELMDRVFYDNGGQDHDDWVATINTVAERLEEHGYHDAGDFLRTEARRAREGQ